MAKNTQKPEDWLQGDNLILLEGWARDGLSNEQIYTNMGLGKTKFYEWMQIPNFANVIKKNREVLDYEVENILMTMCREKNTAAVLFWLKNRRPDKWKDKVEVLDKREVEQLQEVKSAIFSVKKREQK